MGVGRYLQQQSAVTQIVAVEPPPGHCIQGLKSLGEAIVPAIYHGDQVQRHISIDDETAFDMARRLARHEGLFVGMSSGAAVAGAYRLARELTTGTAPCCRTVENAISVPICFALRAPVVPLRG